MKIKRLIFFVLTIAILSGLSVFAFISVLDTEKTTRSFDQNQVKVPDIHSAASISKGTILLLLAVGVIGFLGVSRKKKDVVNLIEEDEMNKVPDHQNLNE
jgi:hypothetical protein